MRSTGLRLCNPEGASCIDIPLPHEQRASSLFIMMKLMSEREATIQISMHLPMNE